MTKVTVVCDDLLINLRVLLLNAKVLTEEKAPSTEASVGYKFKQAILVENFEDIDNELPLKE